MYIILKFITLNTCAIKVCDIFDSFMKFPVWQIVNFGTAHLQLSIVWMEYGVVGCVDVRKGYPWTTFLVSHISKWLKNCKTSPNSRVKNIYTNHMLQKGHNTLFTLIISSWGIPCNSTLRATFLNQIALPFLIPSMHVAKCGPLSCQLIYIASFTNMKLFFIRKLLKYILINSSWHGGLAKMGHF